MYQNATEIRRHDLEGPLMQEAALGYTTPRVLPVFSMRNRQGSLPTIVRTDDQVLDIKRSPKTSHARIEGEVGRITITAEEMSIEEPIDVTDDDVLGPERAEMAAAFRTRNVLLRATDAALVSALMTTGTFGSGFNTGAINTWNHADGDPLADVERAKEKVFLRTGREDGTCLLISRGLQRLLSESPVMRARAGNIVARLGDDRALPHMLDATLLAAIFGLEEVVIAAGVKNSAQKGLTTVREFICPNTSALVFQRSMGDDLGSPQLGRTFVWDAGTSVEEESGTVDDLAGLVVETYREAKISADIIRAKNYLQQRVLLKDAGHLITGTAS